VQQITESSLDRERVRKQWANDAAKSAKVKKEPADTERKPQPPAIPPPAAVKAAAKAAPKAPPTSVWAKRPNPASDSQSAAKRLETGEMAVTVSAMTMLRGTMVSTANTTTRSIEFINGVKTRLEEQKHVAETAKILIDQAIFANAAQMAPRRD
jgi:hypothetical protein